MQSPSPQPTLSLFAPPYDVLRTVTGGREQLRREAKAPGCGLVWQAARGFMPQDVPIVLRRPGGLALILVLPQADRLPKEEELLKLTAAVRPQSILPAHDRPSPEELRRCLRRPPQDLGAEVAEYLAWRGIRLDRETKRLVRKMVDASAELRSVSALARSLYISRRALGRRFMSRGLPVPSHWLHFARALRVAIRLQNSDESVLSIGFELGYPDGFSVSNQMMRLIGCRPTEVRANLGWEWIVEAWLRREADQGGLSPAYTEDVLGSRRLDPSPASASPGLSSAAHHKRRRKAAG